MFRLSTGRFVKKKRKSVDEGQEAGERAKPRVRADAQRNIEALLEAAKEVFIASGVDAPVRAIAEQAGVGLGTVYRHFPQRSDLIVAIIRHEVDACADAATTLAKKYQPFEALSRWMWRYIDLVAAKRGLAAALHSGDPAYEALPAYFKERLCPSLQTLLDAASAAGEVREDVNAYDLLIAVAGLCSISSHPAIGTGPDHAKRMVGLLVDGLRYRSP
jgi:AcrR family transcriptional regulator